MRIRPLEKNDVPEMARLWQYWFRDKTTPPAPGLAAYLEHIYFDNPRTDPEIPSLIAEDADGRALGFLPGTVSRFTCNGQDIRLACCYLPFVDPALKATTVATFLIRKYMHGPQELTFTDGGYYVFEKIWETLGGVIAPLSDIRWTKVFRPFEFGANRSLKRRNLQPVKSLVRGLAKGADALAGLFPQDFTKVNKVETQGEALTPAKLLAHLPEIARPLKFYPAYDQALLEWQFKEMAKITSQGSFRSTLVRDQEGQFLGWYIYYCNPGKLSRVFQIVAVRDQIDKVMDHLFYDARQGGAGALLGQMEDRLRGPVSTRGCFLQQSGSMRMLHSRTPELLQMALSSRALFSRFDGENWYVWGSKSPTLP